MPQQANTPFNMFDAFAYHPSPKVNNFRSLLGVFCTVGFLFFQGVFMFTSISGYVFNPPTTEADLVNIHAKEGSIISKNIPQVGFQVYEGGTSQVSMAFEVYQITSSVVHSQATTEIVETYTDMTSKMVSPCTIKSNDGAQKILDQQQCLPEAYELLGGMEDSPHKRLRLVVTSDMDLDKLWSKSLRLVVKDNNPFRMNNSIFDFDVKFVRNTKVHVEIEYVLNKVVQPDRYFPSNISHTYSTFQTYTTSYTSLRKPMPRTIATVDISLQFEVKMEIQRYKELLSMLADWGCMATFLFAFFGVPGLYINALRFKLQLKGVDLRQVSGDQFNAHGGLKAPNLRLPMEVQGYADDDNWQLAILSAEETAEAAKLKAEPRVQKQEFA